MTYGSGRIGMCVPMVIPRSAARAASHVPADRSFPPVSPSRVAGEEDPARGRAPAFVRRGLHRYDWVVRAPAALPFPRSGGGSSSYEEPCPRGASRLVADPTRKGRAMPAPSTTQELLDLVKKSELIPLTRLDAFVAQVKA